jgi:hypothetical protein
MTIPFWLNDPSILLNKDNILQLWPTQQMTFEAKLNAISRIVILLSFLGFLFTKKTSLLVICVLTLAIMYSIYIFRKQKIVKSLLQDTGLKEGFTSNTKNINDPVTLNKVLKNEFYPIHKKNPFGNVLLTDIMDDPEKKAAPPSFNPDVSEKISNAVKKQTQMLYPDIKNTNKQLYGDLYDNYQFDTDMMQRFYSMPNTRVTNDQGAFSKWLYGNMYSAKESTPEGAWMRVKDNYRYILI